MFASAVRIIHLITLAAVVLPAASGCSTLFTAAYLFQPADVPAEFTGLRGKHVAIACRPIVELEFTDAGSARELASLVGGLLSEARSAGRESSASRRSLAGSTNTRGSTIRRSASRSMRISSSASISRRFGCTRARRSTAVGPPPT